MKKLLLTTTMAITVAVSISSCSKCQICTKDSSPEMRICESDYSSNTQYGLALDYQEANGYTCK